MAFTIGVDIGTSGTKSLLIDPDGNILAEASASYGVSMPKPMWTEQDPEDWWNAVVKTVRAVVKQSKVAKTDVKCIGLSGQMHGSVFLTRMTKSCVQRYSGTIKEQQKNAKRSQRWPAGDPN